MVLHRLGDVEVVALAEVNQSLAETKAKCLSIDRAYGDYRRLIADEGLEVIHSHPISP